MQALTMARAHKLILIDSDSRRRASATHFLSSKGIFVDPVEDVNEINDRWPGDGVLFVHDSDGAIKAIAASMLSSGVWLPIIAYSCASCTRKIVEALNDGAIDYIEWPLEIEIVQQVLETIQADVGNLRSFRHRQFVARNRIGKLTRREREVLDGVADGLSNRKIGEKLRISARTVEIHRANMLTKIGAKHTSEAIRVAIEASLESSSLALAA